MLLTEPFPWIPGSSGGAWHRNGARVGRGGSRVPGVVWHSWIFPGILPKKFPLFPLPEARCRHGENGKEKKKGLKHLPTTPAMICASGGGCECQNCKGQGVLPIFNFSVVIPEHLPEVDGGEGALCVRGSRVRPREPPGVGCITQDCGAEFLLSLPEGVFLFVGRIGSSRLIHGGKSSLIQKERALW